MIKHLDPRHLLGIGFVLLMMGYLLPLLMVLHVIQSTLFLNFFSYVALTLGTMLGFIGSVSIAARHWRK
jgi:hypothetical protein